MTENKLLKDKHIIILNKNQLNTLSNEINIIKEKFCGFVIDNIELLKNYNYSNNTIIYLTGDIQFNYKYIENQNIIYIIKELSYNYNFINNLDIKIITLGEVPININNVGVYFRNFFNNDTNYFDKLVEEHNFQELTESNKPSNSYRKGIYLCNVKEENNRINFNLLRCSTNLNGPTENFKSIDNNIINKVNNISEYFFEQKVDLNHVLAQIYNNHKNMGIFGNEERKAKIKAHSDKTKDMPTNAIMAFCTFYKTTENNEKIKKSNINNYDLCYNDTSIYTCLRFKLKKMVNNENLTKQFDITLYPNSVFLMSLKTNRLYTHEIIPPVLPVDYIPTRLGYVIRCSKTKAYYSNNENKTYIIENGENIKLEKADDNKKISELKEFYYKENSTDEIINYKKFYFSLNNGDYMKPNI